MSLSSTIARLLTGLAADYLAPQPIALPLSQQTTPYGTNDRTIEEGETDEESARISKHQYMTGKVRLSRSSFTAICAVVLALIFGWSAGFLDGEERLWVFSGGVGLMYGALFTLTVSLVFVILISFASFRLDIRMAAVYTVYIALHFLLGPREIVD